MRIDRPDVEVFRDLLTENALTATGPPSAATIIKSGKCCTLQALAQRQAPQVTPAFLLHTQAERDITVRIAWEE